MDYEDDDDVAQEPASGDVTFSCAVCGQENEVFIDKAAGEVQRMTEDCRWCCHPNLVHVRWADFTGEWDVWAEAENE